MADPALAPGPATHDLAMHTWAFIPSAPAPAPATAHLKLARSWARIRCRRSARARPRSPRLEAPRTGMPMRPTLYNCASAAWDTRHTKQKKERVLSHARENKKQRDGTHYEKQRRVSTHAPSIPFHNSIPEPGAPPPANQHPAARPRLSLPQQQAAVGRRGQDGHRRGEGRGVDRPIIMCVCVCVRIESVRTQAHARRQTYACMHNSW